MRVLLLAAIATLSLTACKPAEPSKMADSAAGYAGDKAADSSAAVKTAESAGTSSDATASTASTNLPANVPLYPGATFTKTGSSFLESMKADEKAGRAGVTFSTTDTPAKVVTFYKDAFTKAGMTEKGGGEMGNVTIVSYAKGPSDQMGVQVIVGAVPEGGTSFEVLHAATP